MKLSVKTLSSPHQVEFENRDSWLKEIARELTPSEPESSNIRGNLTLKQDSAGFVHATGTVTAQATQPCDRCGRDVQFPIESSINVTFRPPYVDNAPREIALSPEDLDVYFIEDDHIDLEVLINDTLQCAIPTHILCHDSDSEGCSEDEDDGLVYGESTPHEIESPFAILKNLKKS